MANELTGDYEVVAEFTVAAVNRILSGMHRGNRFPHSMSVRVDDTPSSKRSVRSIVDMDGNALTDRVAVNQTARTSARTDLSTGDLISRNLDPVITDSRREVAVNLFSHLQGVALLQLGAPTIELPTDGSTDANVHTPAMIRYLPDSFSLDLPEFMRGEIVTTLGVRPATSAAGTFIDVGLVGPGGNVHFNQVFPPQPLGSERQKAVNTALRNSLKTRFQPSNTALPDNVVAMDFKAFPDSLVVAALMKLNDGDSSRDSMETVFLHDGDQFALALDGNSITQPFADAVNGGIQPRTQNLDTRIQIDYWIGTYTFHIFTRLDVLTATVQLQDVSPFPVANGSGQILLTIPVQVRFGWEDKPTWVPDPVNFDFTVTQAFTLTLNGGDVGLQALGAVSINIPSNVPAVEANEARNRATALFNNVWNNNQGRIQQQISAALSVHSLQEFVRKMMNPPIQQKTPDTPSQKQLVEVDPVLTYTSFEIKRAGIVMHGSLALLPDPPAPHVEIELDPWTANSSNPEFTLLNTWIPGGTVENYIWSYRGQKQPPDTDTFVSKNAPPIGWSPASICVTVNGSRLTSSGPVGLERVFAGTCKWTDLPKAALNGFPSENLLHLPDIVLDQKPPVHDPRPEVVSHASPWVDNTLQNTVNFLIHFPNEASKGAFDVLTRALEQSGRKDTATAILCVLTPQQFAKTRSRNDIMFADDAKGWERLFDVSSRPVSILLNPSGKVAWRRQGTLTQADLSSALEKHLAAGGFFNPQFFQSPLRLGKRTPNFLFESTPGQELTLRKLTGRPAVVLFGKSSSKPSLDTLRTLTEVVRRYAIEQPVILAVADGEDGGIFRKTARIDKLSAVIVPDPNRRISEAYGVNVWPTAIFLDSEGFVRQIVYGRISEEELQLQIETKLLEAAQSEKEYDR